jgi:hypothetical protein
LRTVHDTIEEIIDLASSENSSVATLLRKCLVLANMLDNNHLQTWANKELVGYAEDDIDLPEYRKVRAQAKGFFIAPRGGHINNQPIPSLMLEKHHRYLAETASLVQPIASYEGVKRDGCIEWPPNVTAFYERKFFQGTYALNRAWQEIPGSVFVGLIDTIKTRVLRFALELKRDLGSVNDDLSRLPDATIDRNVTVNIFGGNNVIATQDVTQVNRTTIKQGDWSGLADALKTLGVPSSEISALRTAVTEDETTSVAAPVSEGRTAKWLKDASKNAGRWALKTGGELAKTEITKWLSQYFGLS